MMPYGVSWMPYYTYSKTPYPSRKGGGADNNQQR